MVLNVRLFVRLGLPVVPDDLFTQAEFSRATESAHSLAELQEVRFYVIELGDFLLVEPAAVRKALDVDEAVRCEAQQLQDLQQANAFNDDLTLSSHQRRPESIKPHGSDVCTRPFSDQIVKMDDRT